MDTVAGISTVAGITTTQGATSRIVIPIDAITYYACDRATEAESTLEQVNKLVSVTMGGAEHVPFEGLLIEGPTTNMMPVPTDISDPSWDLAGTGTASTPIVTKDYGEVGVSRIQMDLNGGTTSSDIARVTAKNLPAPTIGLDYTLSFEAKLNTGTSEDITIYMAGNSAGGSATITDSWQRFVVTYEAAGVSPVFGVALRGSFATSKSIDMLVKMDDVTFTKGFQVEESSHASSFTVGSRASADTRISTYTRLGASASTPLAISSGGGSGTLDGSGYEFTASGGRCYATDQTSPIPFDSTRRFFSIRLDTLPGSIDNFAMAFFDDDDLGLVTAGLTLQTVWNGTKFTAINLGSLGAPVDQGELEFTAGDELALVCDDTGDVEIWHKPAAGPIVQVGSTVNVTPVPAIVSYAALGLGPGSWGGEILQSPSVPTGATLIETSIAEQWSGDDFELSFTHILDYDVATASTSSPYITRMPSSGTDDFTIVLSKAQPDRIDCSFKVGGVTSASTTLYLTSGNMVVGTQLDITVSLKDGDFTLTVNGQTDTDTTTDTVPWQATQVLGSSGGSSESSGIYKQYLFKSI